MQDVLAEIYNACDPFRYATGENYVDLGEVRGSSALMREFRNHLRLAADHLCFLFSGHIGCGKTSELMHLKRELERPSPLADCYFAVRIDFDEYLDDYDVSPTDILLAIVAELASQLKEREGVVIADSYFRRRFDEIKGFFLSDVEINEGELGLGDAKLKIQRLKRDPTARKQVRDALQPQLSRLPGEMNLVFDRARLELRKAREAAGKQACADIVIIADSLERTRKVDNRQPGLDSQRALFLDHYARLTGLRAHVIYTVPIELARSCDGPMLEERYGPLFVLPMVKVIERGTRAPNAKGVEHLRELLAKRIRGHELRDVFEPAALEFLVTNCGGHARQLMMFVQAACAYAERTPIPLTAAHRAIQQTIRLYSTTIPEPYWAKLKALDLSVDQMIPNGDDDYLRMLENLFVLEYVNGGAEEDPYGSAEPWYAVHPIVRELRRFKQAKPVP